MSEYASMSAHTDLGVGWYIAAVGSGIAIILGIIAGVPKRMKV